METNNRRRKLFWPFLLLSAGALLEIANIISNFFAVSDFSKGFIAGIAITLLVFGLIFLATALLKRSH